MGNIQAGGTGKTPLVALIAREATNRGLEVCILTRGYHGKWEKTGGTIRPGNGVPDVRDCGDEPALLHELVPAAWIGVGADRLSRFYQVQKVAEKIDLVILDDGFQNFQIQKSLEILALTSKTRDETFYRDWESQLRYADLLIWTKGPAPRLRSAQPQLEVRFRIPQAVSNSPPLFLIVAVGAPEAVRTGAEEAGYVIRKQISLADHATVPESKARAWLEEARLADCRVAITGKDWMKWRALGISREEVLVLEPVADFVSGHELWERLLWG